MSPRSDRRISDASSLITDRKKVLSSGKRIFCPVCGNDSQFYEIAENVVLTTKYVQNRDGSFTALFDDSAMNGTIRLYCAECDEDLTKFHGRFVEMLF